MKFVRSLLPALAAACLAGCDSNTTATTTAQRNDSTKTTNPDEEKVFIIPPLKLKDESSIHEHLRPLTLYSVIFPKSELHDTLSRDLASDLTLTYTSDTMKLHVKGDYCWIEYISAGTSHAKKKDGGYRIDPSASSENSDTLKIR
ncbi:MAG TPA: hypothetical protein VJ647_00430 [Chitinophagaceae bacterium]|nr:hypothetical protein [Chitinophagaceae bacterium]